MYDSPFSDRWMIQTVLFLTHTRCEKRSLAFSLVSSATRVPWEKAHDTDHYCCSMSMCLKPETRRKVRRIIMKIKTKKKSVPWHQEWILHTLLLRIQRKTKERNRYLYKSVHSSLAFCRIQYLPHHLWELETSLQKNLASFKRFLG